MKIEFTASIDLKKYESLLLSNPNSLLYTSPKHLNFLSAITNCKCNYFILSNDHEYLAVLPCFVKETKYGKALNSLPFYGSNGAVTSFHDSWEYKLELLQFYKNYIHEHNYLVSTIIVSPFEKHQTEYKNTLQPNHIDERIGQLTPLPEKEEELFDSIHYKTRNSIRKGEKSNIEISYEEGENYFDFLFETHKENITAIGGKHKDKSVFELIRSNFVYGSDYKIFVAKLNGEPISALLNFYYNNTVEYYTPVTRSEFRDLQALSAIIWFAMKDAIKNKYKWWNWGGTWHSQKGVYDFKKRWATIDMHYTYFINTSNNSILELSKKEILENFKDFYTVPFNLLKNENV